MPDYFAMRRGELADPMRTVRDIRSDAAVFVIGDARDRSVPHAAWKAWEAAARRRGLRVFDADMAGSDRPELGGGETHHMTGIRALEAAHGCATDVPGEEVRRALVAGEPILRPRGRRLKGEEIKAAFAGRRLAGVVWPHWGTRVTSLTLWGADGKRSEFHPAHPERPVGVAQRWWVEDDRLCTTGDGCNAVLADGRFLHVVAGEPPRFLTTFAAAPPGS